MLDWGPIVLSLIAAAVSLVGLLAGRRKDNASVAETYEAMAARQADEIAKLRQQMREMRDDLEFKEQQIEHLDRVIEEWTAGINILILRLAAEGVTDPPWKPKIPAKMEGKK